MDTTGLSEASRVMGRAGAKARSSLSRSIAASAFMDRAIATRIARHGPTGRRPVDVRLRARLDGGEPNAWLRSWSDWSI